MGCSRVGHSSDLQRQRQHRYVDSGQEYEASRVVVLRFSVLCYWTSILLHCFGGTGDSSSVFAKPCADSA